MSNLSLNQLRPQQVCERLGCGKTQLYELVKSDPTFPKPIQLSKRNIRVFHIIDSHFSAPDFSLLIKLSSLS